MSSMSNSRHVPNTHRIQVGDLDGQIQTPRFVLWPFRYKRWRLEHGVVIVQVVNGDKSRAVHTGDVRARLVCGRNGR